METKFCSSCGEKKTLDKFPSRTTKCRSCADRIWGEGKRALGLDPEQIRRDKKNARRKRQREGTSVQRPDPLKQIKDHYSEVEGEQSGVCAICKNVEKDLGQFSLQAKRLARDHNHKTGGLRGLLCRRCNTGLGLLGDSKEHLLQALNYLTLWEERHSHSSTVWLR